MAMGLDGYVYDGISGCGYVISDDRWAKERTAGKEFLGKYMGNMKNSITDVTRPTLRGFRTAREAHKYSIALGKRFMRYQLFLKSQKEVHAQKSLT